MRATRARHTALVVVDPHRLQCNYTGETSLSIGARPCCDVPAAASKAQPAFTWRARERSTALAVYREEAQHARLRSARVVLG